MICEELGVVMVDGDQTRWGRGANDDREEEHDDREPDLTIKAGKFK